jgi:hypothetical protein
MNDPERYTEDGADPTLRAGLASLRGERPAEGARDRALAAVLAGGTVAAALTTTSAASGATAAATGAANVAVPAKGALGILFAKWAAVGVVSATAVLGTYELSQRREGADAGVPPSSAVVASAIVPRASEPTPLVSAAIPMPSPVSSADLTTSPSAAPPAGALAAAPTVVAPNVVGSPGASAAKTPTVADEVEQLEAIRSAIRARRAGEARAAVAAYRQAFPKGVLASEAFVLEIEATALDRPGEARRMAEAFLKRNPTSPLMSRVRRAGGLGEEPLP